MASKLWEEFERTAHKPAVANNLSGSPARLELRWERDFTNTIEAIKALRDCGLTLHEAKRQIEELMERRFLVIDLPYVPDVEALIARIDGTGAIAKQVTPVPTA